MQKKGTVSAVTVAANVFNYGVDTGAVGNAYIIATGSSAGQLDLITETLVAGMVVYLSTTRSNSGSSTLQIGSGSAVTMKKNGANLVTGDIVNGGIYQFVYDGTNFQMIACY